MELKPKNKYCKLIGQSKEYIQFRILGINVLILNMELTQEYGRSTKKLNNELVFFDKDFKNVKLFFKGEKYATNYWWLYKTLEFIFTSAKKSSYELLMTRELKARYSKEKGLERHPNKEFFLYGNDEFINRYTHKSKRIPKEGIDIRINDDSSLLLNDKGERSIILYVSGSYLLKNKMYLNRDLMKVVKGTKKEHDLVSGIRKGEKREYFKYVLRNNIDFKKEKYVLVSNPNKKIFRLVKIDNVYYLKDDKGLIKMYHYDLLVDIV
jgi:hypothetical protein